MGPVTGHGLVGVRERSSPRGGGKQGGTANVSIRPWGRNAPGIFLLGGINLTDDVILRSVCDEESFVTGCGKILRFAHTRPQAGAYEANRRLRRLLGRVEGHRDRVQKDSSLRSE